MHMIQVLIIAAECAAGWGAKAKSMRSRVTGRQKKNPAGAGFVCGLIVSLEIGRRVKRKRCWCSRLSSPVCEIIHEVEIIKEIERSISIKVRISRTG